MHIDDIDNYFLWCRIMQGGQLLQGTGDVYIYVHIDTKIIGVKNSFTCVATSIKSMAKIMEPDK